MTDSERSQVHALRTEALDVVLQMCEILRLHIANVQGVFTDPSVATRNLERLAKLEDRLHDCIKLVATLGKE